MRSGRRCRRHCGSGSGGAEPIQDGGEDLSGIGVIVIVHRRPGGTEKYCFPGSSVHIDTGRIPLSGIRIVAFVEKGCGGSCCRIYVIGIILEEKFVLDVNYPERTSDWIAGIAQDRRKSRIINMAVYSQVLLSERGQSHVVKVVLGRQEEFSSIIEVVGQFIFIAGIGAGAGAVAGLSVFFAGEPDYHVVIGHLGERRSVFIGCSDGEDIVSVSQVVQR